MRVMNFPGFPGTNLPWTLSPLEALRRWPIGQRVVMLHSGRPEARWSRYTLLARADGAYRFVADEAGGTRGAGGTGGTGGGRSEWVGDADSCPVQIDQFKHRPLHDLGQVLADRDALWVGYLGYDLGRYIEKLPSVAKDDRGWPIVQMQRCPGWLVHDNVTGQWRACGVWRDLKRGGVPDLPTLPVNEARFHADTPKPLIDRAAHERAIASAIEYIAAGDVFQVNLTQRFTAPCNGNPRALYDTLARQSPAWYGAYLELETSQNGENTQQPARTIACNSPELFFSLDEQRNVTTRPIKGTRPASADPRELLNSAKDHAELTMIVDLLRNDLGRVCAYGSVQVPEPRVIESHPTVHHTAATVTGKLHPSKTLIDLLRAVMPGGSITGAPKVRAMQIIDELEPVRRGPYTGAIGYIHRDTACFNIAIRTLLIENGTDDAFRGRGHVDYSVGGGIVADSTPAGEYQESLDKAQAMMRALAASQKPQPIHAV